VTEWLPAYGGMSMWIGVSEMDHTRRVDPDLLRLASLN